MANIVYNVKNAFKFRLCMQELGFGNYFYIYAFKLIRVKEGWFQEA